MVRSLKANIGATLGRKLSNSQIKPKLPYSCLLASLRAVQAKARRILYPANPQEMAEILAELGSHQDPESHTLAGQLEERLQSGGYR